MTAQHAMQPMKSSITFSKPASFWEKVKSIGRYAFLWGYAKSLVYVDKPAMIELLEANIEPQMLEKMINNWADRTIFINK